MVLFKNHSPGRYNSAVGLLLFIFRLIHNYLGVWYIRDSVTSTCHLYRSKLDVNINAI